MKPTRMISLFVAASLFVTPVMYAEKPSQPHEYQQLTPEQARRVVAQAFAKQKQIIAFTTNILGNDQTHTPLMNEGAQAELQLDRLIQTIAIFSQTLAGKWAIKQMTTPIADDPTVIFERQKIIKYFLEHEDVLAKMNQSLQAISKAEDALWKYWDPAEEKESARLFNRAHSLYYQNIPSPSWLSSDWFDVNAWLNSQRWALKGVPYVDLFKKLKEVLYAIGFYHVTQKICGFMLGKDNEIMENPTQVFLDSMYSVGRRHDPRPYLFDGSTPEKTYRCNDPSKGSNWKEWNDYSKSMMEGSLGDKLRAAWEGYNFPGTRLPFTDKKIFELKPCNEMSFFKKWFWRSVGVTGVVAGVLGMDMFLAYSLKQSYDGGKSLWKTMNALRKHLTIIARGIERLKECYALLLADPVLKDHKITHDLGILFDKKQKKLQEILKLLESDTFRNTVSVFFDRGKVLWTHRLIKQSRDVFKPVLRAIGQLDAYCVMSDVMKSREFEANKYSFVTFVESPTAMLEIKDGWLPLINGQAVSNTITFGNGNPNHGNISGPNGAGKSAILYTIGNIIALAQSWGIVPATAVCMSWFNKVCTSFNPRESMQDDMSTFMEQQRSMNTIYHQINIRAQKKVAILVDEPYNGTVDVERAKRTYEYGQFLVDKQNVISCMATHVKKPVSLAYDYPESFANYHQEIIEPAPGIFKRTYRLLPGEAHWWFEDAERRSRYVDWLRTEYEKGLVPPAA